jgi:hypothetical protein
MQTIVQRLSAFVSTHEYPLAMYFISQDFLTSIVWEIDFNRTNSKNPFCKEKIERTTN